MLVECSPRHVICRLKNTNSYLGLAVRTFHVLPADLFHVEGRANKSSKQLMISRLWKKEVTLVDAR